MGKWALYGLLENREIDHDLRFLSKVELDTFDDFQAEADKYEGEYEIVVAFDTTRMHRASPGEEWITTIAPVAALMGGRARWPGGKL